MSCIAHFANAVADFNVDVLVIITSSRSDPQSKGWPFSIRCWWDSRPVVATLRPVVAVAAVAVVPILAFPLAELLL